MTPQSSFMILAPIELRREQELRSLLSSMNSAPGRVDANNSLLPFGRFDVIHFARIVILDDPTQNDVEIYGIARRSYPLYLALLADVDGSADAFLLQLVRECPKGLRNIFSCCQLAPGDDLTAWIEKHRVEPAANYVNWRGRTVRQLREEAALHTALAGYSRDRQAELAGKAPGEMHRTLREYADKEISSGRLQLTPEPVTPVGWKLRNLANLVGVPLALLVLSPFLLVYLPFFVILLRGKERRDPEICPPPDSSHAAKLSAIEDHYVANQFSAMGTLKPGLFRRSTITFVLWLLDYTARHIYYKGHLARVSTIHFARWVFLDQKQRLFFASNYDGSLDSYMDDFINKVAFGLNVVFSNGVGYPRSNWLVSGGAKDEQKFKYFIRRHELATEVWYDAHPGLTTSDLERNTRIRQGFETSLTDEEAREWLALL
jgi:hypothetical protein